VRGRKKINHIRATAPSFLCAIQGYFIALGLKDGAPGRADLRIRSRHDVPHTTSSRCIGGTMFLMWLGEQITSRGIGNGISLIIMAGIVAQLPTRLPQAIRGGRTRLPCRRCSSWGVLALGC
jgi:preprotein translocase subunit SecY